ncbi:MAG: shikimate dehydrogenase, partial [Wenzhouxiangellaceae bacterium]
DYAKIDCPSGRLAAMLGQFVDDGGTGCNLTVPLKAEGLRLVSSSSQAARDAGACNTLVRQGRRWHAENTDGAGLIADLVRLGIDPAGRRVLIVGAGGAVAGVVGPLLDRNPACLCVVNRDGEKAEQLIQRFERPGVEMDAAALADGPRTGGFDLLIQGTSLGHQGECPPIDPAWMAPDAVGYDLNYGEAFEPFRAWCEQAGLACHSGLGMLVEQAALAFELFTGTRPETAPVHQQLAAQPPAP